MAEVSKSELAKYLGVSQAMVSKHVKSGILDKCFSPNGKKLILEKAIQAIALSKTKDTTLLVKSTIPNEIKNNESLDNKETQNELVALLKDAQSPSQKVQIIKDFWIGKINRQKFLENEGELITVQDAKVAIDALLSPLNQYMNDQGNHLKNNFPDLPNEVVEWIDDENNRQKEQLRVIKWD